MCVCVLQGDNVWVDSEIGVPIGARVRKVEGDKCIVVDDAGKVRRLVIITHSTQSRMKEPTHTHTHTHTYTHIQKHRQTKR